MKKTENKGLLRVVDANSNRCKEGLRVVEDIFRFIIQDDSLRKRTRKLRHAIESIVQEKIIKEGILSRDSNLDLGRHIDALEIKRSDVSELLYSNLQRAKESLRVLEECFKIVLPASVSKIKKIRYDTYTLEKNIFKKRPSLFIARPKGHRKQGP